MKRRDTYARDVDMEYDPSNLVFAKWLVSKFYNHLDMDWYTKNALWIYWARGDDEVELFDKESLDPDDENLIDEDEVAEIFRIETNIFDFETPTCRAFKEFNYHLQINPEVLTKDIDGVKTYKEYKDDRIYEWNNGHSKWPTCSWKNDGYCNGGNLTRAYVVGNTLRYQDLEWYEALKDGELKDEALKNKAIMERIINEDDESNNEVWRRWDDSTHNSEMNDYKETDDTTHYALVCKIRRFEMIKYSFGQDEEYVAIKECEYDDLTKTNEDSC
ncbi:VIER F-box protein 2 [Tanacetum coccineum]